MRLISDASLNSDRLSHPKFDKRTGLGEASSVGRFGEHWKMPLDPPPVGRQVQGSVFKRVPNPSTGIKEGAVPESGVGQVSTVWKK